jgi:hypothetical protein
MKGFALSYNGDKAHFLRGTFISLKDPWRGPCNSIVIDVICMGTKVGPSARLGDAVDVFPCATWDFTLLQHPCVR